MNKDALYPVSKTDDFLTQQLDDELLLYNLKTNQTFCLNETAALVWRKADGKNSVTDMTAALSNTYASKIPEDFVWFALHNLARNGLMTNVSTENLSYLDRREIIKKIGLGTMIVLPMISTLIAPNAARASSTCLAPGANLFPGAICGDDNGTDCGCSRSGNRCCSGRTRTTSACTRANPCSCLCAA